MKTVFVKYSELITSIIIKLNYRMTEGFIMLFC